MMLEKDTYTHTCKYSIPGRERENDIKKDRDKERIRRRDKDIESYLGALT